MVKSCSWFYGFKSFLYPLIWMLNNGGIPWVRLPTTQILWPHSTGATNKHKTNKYVCHVLNVSYDTQIWRIYQKNVSRKNTTRTQPITRKYAILKIGSFWAYLLISYDKICHLKHWLPKRLRNQLSEWKYYLENVLYACMCMCSWG